MTRARFAALPIVIAALIATLSPALDGFKKIDFRGRLFCVVHPENEPDFQVLDPRVPHAEAAAL